MTTLSTQVEHLSHCEKQRYIEKVAAVGLGDPYLLPARAWKKLLECEASDVPNITYPDIYMFLINRHSVYTSESLKAYKSLDAYKYFVAGFVSEVNIIKTNGNKCLLMSKVSYFRLFSLGGGIF